MSAITTRLQSGIAWLELDIEGEPVNMITKETRTEFEAALDRIGADGDVRAVVLISRKPDSFIVGADINEFAALRSREAAHALDLYQQVAARLTRHLSLHHVHLADEIGDEKAVGMFIQFARRGNLPDHATVHHGGAVGHRQGLVLIMGDDNEGNTDGMLQAHQFQPHGLAQLGVQRAQRLIQQQHIRAGQQ